MSLIFGGDGSYMAPFCLQSDNILTSLLSQSVPPTIWYRFVAGLNARLLLVRRGHLKIMFAPVISWIDTHVNPIISPFGVSVHLLWFQCTGCGYCQYGLVVCSTENSSEQRFIERADRSLSSKQLRRTQSDQSGVSEQLLRRKRVYGGILHALSLKEHKEEKAMCPPLSFVIHGTKPVGHQDLVGLVISVLLLGDFSLVLLTLLQMYSISLLDFFLVLCILPLGIVFPLPAGIKALFSHGPKRSASHARVYALWNITSIVNVIVAFISGFHHYKIRSKSLQNLQSWISRADIELSIW